MTAKSARLPPLSRYRGSRYRERRTRDNDATKWSNRYNARLIFRRLGDFLCEWLATRVFLARRLLRVDGMQGVDLFWIYFVGCGGTILEFLSRMEDF